jgi:hypothetical protein
MLKNLKNVNRRFRKCLASMRTIRMLSELYFRILIKNDRLKGSC